MIWKNKKMSKEINESEKVSVEKWPFDEMEHFICKTCELDEEEFRTWCIKHVRKNTIKDSVKK